MFVNLVIDFMYNLYVKVRFINFGIINGKLFLVIFFLGNLYFLVILKKLLV